MIGKTGAALACIALALAAHAPDAHAWPDKPITIVVPAAPGGGSDFLGRLFAEHLSQSTGQTVTVENIPGAGQTIGYANVARSAPDGHRMVMTDSSQTAWPAFYPRLSFDVLDGIEPASMMIEVPVAIIATPGLKVNSVSDLIKLAKAEPGKLNFGSGGIGAGNHLSGEVFKSITGTQIAHVPYKGAGPAMTGVLTGEIQLMFAGMTTGGIAQNHAVGKIRVLAVSGNKRAASLPNVPSAAEAGIPQYDYTQWWGIAVPKGTPQAVIDRLNAEARAFLNKPETRDKLTPMNAQVLALSHADARQRIARETKERVELVKQLNIKID